MKKLVILILVIISLSAYLFPQSKIKVMSYNLLNYPGTDTTIRNPYFRTVINSVQPDILVAQEILSQAGVTGFLNNVMNSSGNIYTAGRYVEEPDNDAAIFYKAQEFTFLNFTTIQTNQKKISQFKILYNSSGDTLILFALHLKPGSGSTNEADRGKDIDSLRKITDKLPSSAYFMVTGDFNTTGSNEPYYEKLLDQSKPGYFIDPVSMTGTWNSAVNSLYHTRSTRLRFFGGGLTGGLGYRSDLILYSKSLSKMGSVNYIPGSYTVFGNDGSHFNDSINRPPNTAVEMDMADALHYASDHLPVIVTLEFNKAVSVEKDIINSIAEGFQLYQNFPNPFNPSTNISYVIPNLACRQTGSSFVIIKILDILGNEVETIVNEYQSAGYHSALFTLNSALSSGIYFYKMEAHPSASSGQVFVQTGKMLLLK